MTIDSVVGLFGWRDIPPTLCATGSRATCRPSPKTWWSVLASRPRGNKQSVARQRRLLPQSIASAFEFGEIARLIDLKAPGSNEFGSARKKSASSGEHQPMNPYIFDNAAEAETAERFKSLDALYNFRTFRFLETTGIGPGWHRLEVGGGSGAVAAWMAGRAGARDRCRSRTSNRASSNVRSGAKPPNRTAPSRRRRRPAAERAFDLIHARLVLQHVPQRHQALASLVAALKPCGWLVIEEFDGRTIDRTIPLSDVGVRNASRKSKGGEAPDG